MALKIKAREKKLKFSKESEGEWRYVMQPELYSSLTQSKVIKEAALRSGVSEGVMQACWDAAGEVEDPENSGNGTTDSTDSGNSGGGTGTITPSGGDNGGTNNGGGDNGGGSNPDPDDVGGDDY